MRVIERLVRGKQTDQRGCEDAIVETANFVAVIDGATDKSNREFRGECGGRFAAETLVEAFGDLSGDVDLTECVAALTTTLRNALTNSTRLDIEQDDGPSAVFVAYSSVRREIWRVGDGIWRVGSKICNGQKDLDLVAATMRVALLRALLAGGERSDELRRNDPGRQLILPLLRHQYRFRNGSDEQFAYGALDGRPVPERFLERWPIPPGTELILASDGYPTVYETLHETEKYLAEDLVRDPMRIQRHWETKGQLPGYESFDDRAYIRIMT